MWALVQVQLTLLPVQLSVSGLGNAEEGGPSGWACATYMGDLGGAPDSWLQRGPTVVVVDVWGVETVAVDGNILLLAPPSFLCNSDFSE